MRDPESPKRVCGSWVVGIVKLSARNDWAPSENDICHVAGDRVRVLAVDTNDKSGGVIVAPSPKP
jgi:hypothetical protein